MNTYPTGQCRDATCKATIIWAVTPGGRSMPVDAAPRSDGNVLLTRYSDDQPPIARVVDPATPPLGGWDGDLYVSHFTTCPAAEQWRARRTRMR